MGPNLKSSPVPKQAGPTMNPSLPFSFFFNMLMLLFTYLKLCSKDIVLESKAWMIFLFYCCKAKRLAIVAPHLLPLTTPNFKYHFSN